MSDPASTTYVALLRGVNVGGKALLPMAPLRAALTEAGFSGVTTYIQSGNVVLGSSLRAGEAVAEAVQRVIAATFALPVHVVVRRGEEVVDLVAGGPRWSDVEPAKVLVLFFAAAPAAAELAAVEAGGFGPERFELHGRELHLRLPDGIGRSKLVVELGRRLSEPSTGRNWNTVVKLAALVRAHPAYR